MPRKPKPKLTKKDGRWRKRYHGRDYYFPFENYPTAELAWGAWLQKKAEVDLLMQQTKPYREEYSQAIQGRTNLAQWCREAGIEDVARVVQKSADALLARFNRCPSPPPITPHEADPLAALPYDATLAGIPGAHNTPDGMSLEVWRDRLNQYDRKSDSHHDIDSHIKSFLDRQKNRIRHGGKKISLGWWGVQVHHLEKFERCVGKTFPIENINGKTLEDYHSYLCREIDGGRIAPVYAKACFNTLKQFIKWAWSLELCDLPRNMNQEALGFDTPKPVITPFTSKELKAIWTHASERMKLYILLGLNCGFTQVDISLLSPQQVNWEEGTITRKRVKTEKYESVPTVRYQLWKEAFELLKKYRSSHAQYVLLNQHGKPLLTKSTNKAGTRTKKKDNIAKAFDKLRTKAGTTKSFKSFRKTGPSKLKENPRYIVGVPTMFLGQAPVSMVDKHYGLDSQALLDEAVDWLGEQFREILSLD